MAPIGAARASALARAAVKAVATASRPVRRQCGTVGGEVSVTGLLRPDGRHHAGTGWSGLSEGG